MNQPPTRSHGQARRRRGLSGLLLLLGASIFFLAGPRAARLEADVTLLSLFKDNMVLQRGIKLPVWGAASPGEAVTVSIGKQAVKTVAGEDKKFVWADARIQGDSVVVSSDRVEKPVAVCYAWADNPICNLYNKEGLPALFFRTDTWDRR